MMGFGVSFVLRMMAYFGIEAVPMDPGIMSRAVFFIVSYSHVNLFQVSVCVLK